MKAALLDRVLSITLTLAAVVIAVVAVLRYLTPTTPEVPLGADLAGEHFEDWRTILPHSILVGGNPTAQVIILEFADLECPVCRGFHETVADLLESRGEEVAVRYVSYPLAQHRFAYPAARALECADDLQMAGAWIASVYRNQDSLGLKSWGSMAQEAGIPDTTRIAQCATVPDRYERLEAGRALGDQVGIRGTPTLLINGWKFTGALSREALDSAIAAMSEG